MRCQGSMNKDKSILNRSDRQVMKNKHAFIPMSCPGSMNKDKSILIRIKLGKKDRKISKISVESALTDTQKFETMPTTMIFFIIDFQKSTFFPISGFLDNFSNKEKHA